MIQALVRKLLGRDENRYLRKHQSVIDAINRHKKQLTELADDQLSARAAQLREQAMQGAEQEQLLPEVFALVREAAQRTLGMRHFDVQLLGGFALSQGMIAEMKTGEGKTLAATLPAGLAALCGTPVHVVTVNDYLATRDAQWMTPVYAALGITVGTNVQGADAAAKQAAYRCDVVYGTNSQFGFDYLADNLAQNAEARLQRGLGMAIVDEVDSILIDEARTPLAISGPTADQTSLYKTCDTLASAFQPGEEVDGVITNDFVVDEKTRQVHFSDNGYDRAEKVLAERGLLRDGGLYEAQNLNLMHHLVAALRAHYLYARDRDYVVKDRKVVIVDEHTGRLMRGRRWGEGMHQAVEAKENLPIEHESQTLASISLQNYYRQYERLAGMTGTAQTEAEEFAQIYSLEVAPIPTHRNMIRGDQLDRVFPRKEAKLRNIVADIAGCVEKNQPVLVGTTSVESSEELSGLLTKDNVAHEVLNAKQHEREAEIITQAGMPGRVTITTSMAGRGTDILLGGNIDVASQQIKDDDTIDLAGKQERLAELKHQWQQRHDAVVAVGGLRVIGTERHESRRIDNQLRGRAGRQGDPGSSVFYLSFEDPLLRVFADRKVGGLINKLMTDQDEPLEAAMVSRVIEKAQQRVEGHYFDIRKQLLEYDDIANDQRQIIYDQRHHIVDAADISAVGEEFTTAAVESIMGRHLPADAPEEEWNADAATADFKKTFGLDLPIASWLEQHQELSAAQITDQAVKAILAAMAANLAQLGADTLRYQKILILEVIDTNWRQHLTALDQLRQGIGLRGFAQKNPKQEYRREAMGMFNTLLDTVRLDAARILLTVRLRETPPEQTKPTPEAQPAARPPLAVQRAQLPAGIAKPGRNAPCPCGSGKKFKHCHGAAS